MPTAALTQLAVPPVIPAGLAALSGSTLPNRAEGLDRDSSITRSFPLGPVVGEPSSPGTSLGNASEAGDAIAVQGSIDVQLSTLSIAVDLSVENIVNLDVGGTVVAHSAVKPEAGVASVPENSVVPQLHTGQGESQGMHAQEGAANGSSAAKVYVETRANTSSSLAVNEDAALGVGSGLTLRSGADEVSTQKKPDSSPSGGPGLGLGESAARVSTTTDIGFPFAVDNGSDSVVISAPVRSEETLASAEVVASLPSQTHSPTAFFSDAVGGAEMVRASESQAPPTTRPVAMIGSGSEGETDSPLPSPHSQGLAADWLSLDLGALGADIATFLEQVEQLGADWSSLLGRMHVSPLLMAVTLAVLAGEITRRQRPRPRHRPLLAACEGTTGAWFPSLTGPWSLEES
jgi:hypothetical protein